MRQLPRDLMGAADALADSATARTLFGTEFVNAFVASRRHEFDALRRAVSAEEKARYFEIA
jgi:glutamine synthetase